MAVVTVMIAATAVQTCHSGRQRLAHPDPNKTARLIYQPDMSTVCSFLAVETCDQTQRVISHDSPVSSDKQKLCERALDDRKMRETVFLLLPSVSVPASFNLLAELIPACPQLSYFFVTLFPNFTCNLTHPFTLPLLVFCFSVILYCPLVDKMQSAVTGG